ncbi:mechanosensitive ion channel family protein [Synechococcus sp. Nb3U1]|uniref:mechanosensitive ion channel family protein n=1 Tax=Synechococcus sp. Nb3U1 TaxID=1914529 RepID=UPI001F3E52A8|nr:mechanosensitive ion channel domain-containing protein [Synechococcus sp. Nb3U1]MCF2971980.1 mechanosensitive ion channel family protein [Synechococcus sp. Nb3U1]
MLELLLRGPLGMLLVQETGETLLDGILTPEEATESLPARFTGEFLNQVADFTTRFSLQGLRGLLQLMGIDPSGIPLELQSLVATGVLIALIGSLVVGVRRRIRHELHPQRRRRIRHFLTRTLLISLIRPLSFQIWVYGGFLAMAPLLSYLEGYDRISGRQMFRMLHYLIVGSSVAGGVWFMLLVLEQVRNRAKAAARKAKPASFLHAIWIPTAARSLEVITPLLAVLVFFQLVPVPAAFQENITALSWVMSILSLGWVAAQFFLNLDDIILRKFDISAADNLRARTIYTQVHVIQRIGLFLLGLFTIAAVLLFFPAVRQFGQAIIASAGVAGIIIGFAMQKALGNLFAGIQIAFTQPIRLDDVVIVENEWGWIEEITLTYVVVKIWDWRRLVLPISYFIERPFQNWTRTSASIIGTIFMDVDYTIPVEVLREKFEEIVRRHPLWDGRVYCLQVTELKERTVELRVLLSAVDSPKAWDLRCDVREQMLKFVQTHYPECLPQIRIETGSVRFPSERLGERQRQLLEHS